MPFIIAKEQLRLRGFKVKGIDRRTKEPFEEFCILEVTYENFGKLLEVICAEFNSVGYDVLNVDPVEPAEVTVPLNILKLYQTAVEAELAKQNEPAQQEESKKLERKQQKPKKKHSGKRLFEKNSTAASENESCIDLTNPDEF